MSFLHLKIDDVMIPKFVIDNLYGYKDETDYYAYMIRSVHNLRDPFLFKLEFISIEVEENLHYIMKNRFGPNRCYVSDKGLKDLMELYYESITRESRWADQSLD